MIILDSDVLSAAMHSDPLVIGWLDRQPSMSIWTTAITVLEIRFGLASMPVGRRQAERELAFARSIEEKLERRVLPFDHSAAEEAASLMTTRRRVGRPRELRDT
jgi:predicted nucleic acid-binding protein